jgi:4a-hydroxytetrahydrobiopterin dehydratase
VSLAAKRCRPCEGGVPRLGPREAQALHPEIPAWTLEETRLRRRFSFPDFAAAMRFVVRMAEVAEAEGHHPDFSVHYREVDVEIWTHAIGGLSENDFILAAKIDALVQ